ncbi:MAG: hypothetical protein NTW04_05205, partial [Elusimicrobia bacterium]|nr:hypothetical protein [Elusimicrobiota bacterium]
DKNMTAVSPTQWTYTYTALVGYEGAATILSSGTDIAGNITAMSGSFIVSSNPTAVYVEIYRLAGGNPVNPALTTLPTGKYRIRTLVVNPDPIAGTPQMSYLLAGKTYNLTLAYSGSNVWTSDISVESTTPNGLAALTFSARDSKGKTISTITSGGTFTIDTVIPAALGGKTSNSDGTSVISPANSFSKDYIVKIEAADQSLPSIRQANATSGLSPVTGINLVRSINAYEVIGGAPTTTPVRNFAHPLTLRIAYPDANQDGKIDGTDTAETSLKIAYLDEVNGNWVLVNGQVVGKNNWVSTSISHLSIYALLAPAQGELPLLAYPNPCYLKQDGKVTITNIPGAGSASVSIYNIAGKLVRKLEDGADIVKVGEIKKAYWDGRNSDGEKCASDMYVYVVKTPAGTKNGKIGIFW